MPRLAAALLVAALVGASCGSATGPRPSASAATSMWTAVPTGVSETTPPAPIAAAPDVPGPTPAQAQWRRVSGLSAFRDPKGRSRNFDRVSLTTSGLIAVGSLDDGNGVSSTGVWTSTDGLSWKRAPDNPAFDGTFITDILSLTTGATLLVGADETAVAPTAVILGGSDGEFSPIAAFANARIFGITLMNHEFVAVGTTTDAKGNWAHSAIWRSSDGSTWKRTAGPGGAKALSTLAVFDGHLLATSVSGAAAEALKMVTTFWSSTDGVHWSEGDRITGVNVTDLAAAGSVAVAVGAAYETDNAPHPAAWSSPDGTRWTKALPPTLAAAAPELGVLLGVFGSKGMSIAVGWTFGDPSRALAWASLDGSSWALLGDEAALDDAQPADVTVLDGRVVVVGGTGDPDSEVPLVLLGPTL